MFQYKRDFEDEYRGPRDFAGGAQLNPRGCRRSSSWLGENVGRIPIA